MNVLVACEESGRVREAFKARGHYAVSCDFKPTKIPGMHYQGNVLDILTSYQWDLVIAFPDCTYLTNSAEWAYKDPDFTRYPGVGYHQKIKAETLTGAARRAARTQALAFVETLYNCPTAKVAIENPVGALSSLFRQPDQIINPWQFGDDASKATCLWLKNLAPLQATKVVDPRHYCCGEESLDRVACSQCGSTPRPRWGNQTPSGQNKLGPSKDRAEIRSTTYQGIANAMASQWG